jgi:hypothetical protein
MAKKAKGMSLPSWARPNRDELKRLLSGPTDKEIEHAIFGVSSMSGTLWLDVEDIIWDSTRQGTYEEVLAEVEKNPDDYDLRDPLIVDLQEDGRLILNDGHHRFAKGIEEGVNQLRAEIQIAKGQARKYLLAIERSGILWPPPLE